MAWTGEIGTGEIGAAGVGALVSVVAGGGVAFDGNRGGEGEVLGSTTGVSGMDWARNTAVSPASTEGIGGAIHRMLNSSAPTVMLTKSAAVPNARAWTGWR
ncbi:hypothetical protein ACFX59_05680 [Sphingomonas sp. NCPPB 2930]|uniref:hypothetical protein n=1 Tax=Sphingomonas sp. NCPPB 2930 TaxID=3162788 RepID=UPI0036D83E3B